MTLRQLAVLRQSLLIFIRHGSHTARSKWDSAESGADISFGDFPALLFEDGLLQTVGESASETVRGHRRRSPASGGEFTARRSQNGGVRRGPPRRQGGGIPGSGKTPPGA